MEFELPLPANVYPCAVVMQISRFCEKSTKRSVAGLSETVKAASRPPEKKDRTKDNMSTQSLTAGYFSPNTHQRTRGMRRITSYSSGESVNTAIVRITYMDHGGSWV